MNAIVILVIIGATALAASSQINDVHGTTTAISVTGTSIAHTGSTTTTTAPTRSTPQGRVQTNSNTKDTFPATTTAYTDEDAATLVEILQKSAGLPNGFHVVLNGAADILLTADATSAKKTAQNALAVLMLLTKSLDTDTQQLLQKALKDFSKSL